MDNLNEQINPNLPEAVPKSTERVEISVNNSSEQIPVSNGSGAGDDEQGEEIKKKQKEIEEIGDEKQSGQVLDKKIAGIKSLDDLLGIKETADKLKALLVFVKKGEDEKEEALEWAKEIWEDTENAVLLDELRDKLAE